ncbi:MAG: LamG domain-containing protein [Candidatus Bathyarchaeota archaeon]|nr:LamG domain-containing protein [Candidatus Bathyarchaeota archaeon]
MFVDDSPSGNDGTPVNTPVYAVDQRSVANGALTLNGTTDQVNCGQGAETNFTTNDFAISFWAKFTGAGSYFVLTKGVVSAAGNGYGVYFNAGSLLPIIGESGTRRILIGHAGSYNDDVWRNYCIVYDRSGNCSCYTNGSWVSDDDISTYTGSVAVATDLMIGVHADKASGPFPGDMDDVRVHDHALTPAEITNLYTIGLAGILSKSLGGSLTPTGALSSVLTLVMALNGQLDLTGALKGINPAWLIVDKALIWQGEWDISTSYNLNDTVLHKFGDEWHVFISKASHNVGNVPTSSAAWWRRLYQEPFL